METLFIVLEGFLCLLLAVWLGSLLRKRIPDRTLDTDKKDAVKLAMGLIATMSALILGLLVSSAKGTYDTCRKEVVHVAAQIAYLDRILVMYGPEATDARVNLRDAVKEVVKNIWPENIKSKAIFFPEISTGIAVYEAVQNLSPDNEKQRSVKNKALTVVSELGQSISLLRVQSIPSISLPMIIIVMSWICIIFFSFTYISPSGKTVTIAMIASAVSVSGAVLLILELDNPFGGLIRISSEPMLQVLSRIAY